MHQGYDKGDFIVNNFSWLKEISDKCKEEYTCEFRIIYSSSFLKNNLFKQLTFNNLKLISILCIYISVVCIMLIKSYEYIEKMSINTLSSELINDSYALPDEEDEDAGDGVYIVEPLNETDEISSMTKEEAKSKYSFEQSFKKLKKINKETVGYLIVPNTEISYPVVQHSDNSYYLRKDFYKRTTSMGWIYMDYRNNISELDDNSIIYGHSMLNGTMFGTLRNVVKKEWYENKNNYLIDFVTPNGEYTYQVFSVYVIKEENYYINTKIKNNKEFNKFVNRLKSRSKYNFNVNVDGNDKILTLSSCYDNINRRVVLHAKLIKTD